MKFLRALNYSLMAACLSVAIAAAADKPKMPDGPGKDTMVRVCSSCHGPEIVLGRHLTRDGWSQIIMNMIQRGAQGTDDEFADIADYLTNTVSVEAAKSTSTKLPPSNSKPAWTFPTKTPTPSYTTARRTATSSRLTI